jgi:Flp pilus assembly secretin CpaC
MYDNAKETLGKVAEYKEYLSISDVSKLDLLLGKLSSQPSPQVQPPVDQNTTEGKTEPAASEQVAPVQQVQSQQPAINPEYIEFVPVEANDIGQATQTPIPVEQTEIQPEFITPVPQEPQIEIYQPQQPEQNQHQVPAAEKAKEDYIEVVRQKQRIQQSYTKAVVNEAVAKAKEYTGKEDFLKAKDEIARASGTIEKNRLLLGDEDYAQYSATLQQLLNEINARQTEVERLKAEESKAEAQTAQERLRTQQTADRQKRIHDLLAHSMEYQEQQRYEEALVQLETLLAIDQTNREAIRNKQMLEDIINLRRQLEVKKEIGREEQNVLYDTQKSMIPHADLMTYPRNWQDIAAKRKPSQITGLPPVDAAVYKQLETMVDLSALTPDTPFEEAIKIIETSVEPPLKIFVYWKDLEENAYIERDTVINIQGLAGISVGKALKDLLKMVSGGIANIDFIVEEGSITIATKESLPPNLVTHVYDITDLIVVPADFETQLDLSGLTGTGTTGGGQIATDQGEGEQDTIETREQRANDIVTTIQTIEQDSWSQVGGDGTISRISNRLVVNQTPQVHEKIQELFKNMRESLGQQISIETRFLFVTENFLEDIGLGISQFSMNNQGKINDKLGAMYFEFGSSKNTVPGSTHVPGNLSDQISSAAINLAGGVTYGSLLDDLTVSFFLKATQAHRDAKMLTAPRFTVLNGERGYVTVGKQISYISTWEFQSIQQGENQNSIEFANPTPTTAGSGVTLEVRPTISDDKKYVDLRIRTNYTKLRLDPFSYFSPTGIEYFIQLPTWEPSVIETRVSVPDGGTLLIGGQKLGAEVNEESGVPVLSKMPLLGRLFSSRSKVKDQDVLLILVKPTIILQQEAEREYFAPLE